MLSKLSCGKCGEGFMGQSGPNGADPSEKCPKCGSTQLLTFVAALTPDQLKERFGIDPVQKADTPPKVSDKKDPQSKPRFRRLRNFFSKSKNGS